MNLRQPVLLAMLQICLGTTAALAQATLPQVIKIQGYLSQSGLPVNGPTSMSFTLFDAEFGGAVVGTVGPLAVDVTAGLYEVDLPFAEAAFHEASRFLEVTVSSQTLAPRMRLASVPYAYVADTLDGLDATAFAKAVDITTAISSHSANPAAHPSLVRDTGDTITGTLTLTPAAGNALVTTAGNVGIGTTSPTTLLQVAGTIYSSSGGFRFPDGSAQTSAGVSGVTLDQAYDRGGPGAGRTITADSGAVNIAGSSGLTVNGSVGVGTTSPASKLTVAGVIQSTSGGFKFPDGTTQTTASAPKSFVACINFSGSNCTTIFCSCGTATLVTRINSDCTVTSDTGSCSALSFSCLGGGIGHGSCCVCQP